MQLNGGCDYAMILHAIYAEVHMVHDVFMNLLFVCFFKCAGGRHVADVIVVPPCTARGIL